MQSHKKIDESLMAVQAQNARIKKQVPFPSFRMNAWPLICIGSTRNCINTGWH